MNRRLKILIRRYNTQVETSHIFQGKSRKTKNSASQPRRPMDGAARDGPHLTILTTARHQIMALRKKLHTRFHFSRKLEKNYKIIYTQVGHMLLSQVYL